MHFKKNTRFVVICHCTARLISAVKNRQVFICLFCIHCQVNKGQQEQLWFGALDAHMFTSHMVIAWSHSHIPLPLVTGTHLSGGQQHHGSGGDNSDDSHLHLLI